MSFSDLAGLRLVTAPNPSPMTQKGTNTWIVGTGQVAVIDPGPDVDGHLEAILSALEPHERVSAIVVSHAHLDHSELAPALRRVTGAPVYGFGDAASGRNPALEGLAHIGGGEGTDSAFVPDIVTPDLTWISQETWSLQVLHTPGHFGNHICLKWGEHLFSGDHVMGWASTMVSPPDGCMTAYMQTLGRLSGLGLGKLLPGHGAIVEDGPARLAELTAHRRLREAEILAALQKGAFAPPDLTAAIYTNVAPALKGAATRNVLAHLIDLHSRGFVALEGAHGMAGQYRLA